MPILTPSQSNQPVEQAKAISLLEDLLQLQLGFNNKKVLFHCGGKQTAQYSDFKELLPLKIFHLTDAAGVRLRSVQAPAIVAGDYMRT